MMALGTAAGAAVATALETHVDLPAVDPASLRRALRLDA
jgi:hypothetical protein